MRSLLALVLALSSCVSLAADDPKQAVARRLVELLQVEETYRDAATACRDVIDIAGETRKSWEANRERFGVLSPESAYWPEVEALYGRYREEVCNANRVQVAKEIYVQVFARRLSQAELERALAELETPEGKAMQAASREAARLLGRYQPTEQQQAIAAAAQRFREHMADLRARIAAQPR